MNVVDVSEEAISAERGDLYKDPDSSNEVYIIAIIDPNRFAAISLRNGNRFRNGTPTADEAAKGLVRIGRNKKITVT